MNPYQIYELEKKKLQEMKLTQQEYDREIIKLLERLDL